jgi:hypothetical protein
MAVKDVLFGGTVRRCPPYVAARMLAEVVVTDKDKPDVARA